MNLAVLALVLAPLAHADKLEITPKDGVTEFELDCGQGSTLYQPPLLLDPAPPSCKLLAWKPMTKFPGTGKVVCNTSSCEVQGEHEMLEVMAPDPVTAVMLDCDGEQRVWEFVSGKVLIDVGGKECMASLGSTFEGVPPGTWTCGLAECNATKGARTVTLVVTKGSPTSVSLSCGDDVMRKSAIADGKATFADVPNENCTATFEGGGPPAKARPVVWGESACEISGATAVCRKK